MITGILSDMIPMRDIKQISEGDRDYYVSIGLID